VSVAIKLCHCGQPSRNQKRGGLCDGCRKAARYAVAGRKRKVLEALGTAKRARIERLLAEETELGAYFEEVNRLDAT
jgi:hypothetical protein